MTTHSSTLFCRAVLLSLCLLCQIRIAVQTNTDGTNVATSVGTVPQSTANPSNLSTTVSSPTTSKTSTTQTTERTQPSTGTNPDAVTNLIVSIKTISSVYLTWNYTDGSGCEFIVNWTNGNENNSNHTSNTYYNVTGLTAGVNYTFTVTAVSADKQTRGPEIQTSTFTNPDVVTNLTVSNKTTSSVYLTWNNPNGSWSHFIVNWTDGSESNSNSTSAASYNITDLTAGVRYTFTVTAVAGDKQTTGAKTQISTFTKPEAVTNLTVSSSTSTVYLTWAPPPGNQFSFIVYWTDGSENKSSDTSAAFYNITGLTAGVNYTFTVTVVARDNQTTGPETQIATFTNPDVVTNLTVSNKTTSSVCLTWNNPNGNWSHFIVNWTDGSESNSNNTLGASCIPDLTAGVNYSFTVSAVAGDNHTRGAETQTSTFTKPNAVTNLTVSNKTSSSVHLTWNNPIGKWSNFIIQWSDSSENNNSHTSTSIVYQTWNTSDGNWPHSIIDETGDSENNTTALSGTSYTVTGLTAGVNYIFTVTAVAGDNKTKGAETRTSTFSNPNVVTNLTVCNKTTSSVYLTWNNPNGSWSHFIVNWTDGSESNSNSTSAASYNITDLTAGVRYTFTVTAVAGDNQTKGAETQTSTFTKPNIVTSVIISNKTTSSVYLTWAEPDGNWSYFLITWTDVSENNINITSSLSYTVTGLNAGMNYTFTVIAAAEDKTIGAATQKSTFTKPNAVTNLTVSNKTTSSVHLTWNEPKGNWSYFIVKWTDGSENNNSSTSNSSYTVNDLDPGVNYTFTVIAVAADGETEGAPTQNFTFTNPDAVTNLIVSTKTISSVYLTWTYPNGNWSYFIVNWTDGSENNRGNTSNAYYNVTGLNAGMNYTFTVTAVAGDQTLGAQTQTSTFTNPDAVTNLIVSAKTTSSVHLTWSNPNGNWSHFIVHRTDGSENNREYTSNAYYDVTGLTAGVNYTFTVTAVAADNQTKGAETQTSTFTKPDVVKNLKVTEITTSSLFVTWTEPRGEKSFFNVQWSNDIITQNSTTTNNSYNITNLSPGGNYTLLISAVAADNRTEGEEVALSLFSKPDIIRNLTSPIVTSTSVFLDWAEPLGSRSFFRVHWANGNVTKTPATDSNITDLIPGTNYSFSVSAVAADNKTEGSLVWLSTCTVASPVSDITCEGPNHTSPALLTLTWTNPPGNNQGFNISLKQSLSELIPTCNVSCSHTFSTNLKYFSPYTVIILTHGCGESGTQEINCRTGITEPPVPSKPEEVKINATAINEHAVQLMFNTSLLNSTNGPIEAYGVVLSTDHESNISTESLRMNYSDWKHEKTKTYLTVLKFNENIKRSSMITVVIGNGSTGISNTAYENGPLSNEKYSIALVLFTYLNITDRLINIQESIFSVTHYSTTKAKPLDPESNVVAVVLGVLLPIIVLLIIAIIVLVMQKRRITKEYTDIPVNNLRTKISIPVRVEDFESYLKKQQLDSNCGFAEQYEDLKIVGTAQPKNSAIAMENKGKNRYNNVLPYDSSRVKLSVHGSPFDDYINANYISGYNSKKEYIAAQGPLPATVNEFWRMIWEQNSHTIVMLTKCYEQGRVKCERYWPPDNKLYNNILVTTTSEIELEDWTIRDFSIKNVKTAETRNVRQFHFTAWPDHGVPETTEVLINFRHLVREHMESFSHNAPTVVHCSAGVGRTGTFIAVDHLIFQIERESMVDIYGIIHGMRMRRPLMVQTEDQYVFLNQCASDIIKSRMGTNVDLIYQNAAAFSIYENLKS